MMLIFIVFCALLAALIPHILWAVASVVSLLARSPLRYAPFGWAAAGLAAIVALLLAYGFFFGMWSLRVKQVNYANNSIPAAFDGFRIVHISDLHLSTFDRRSDCLERFISEINAQKPDLICFTGDLVTIGRKEAEPFTGILSSLSSRYGVVSILGNHDFLIYRRRFRSDEERAVAVDSLADYQREVLGWHLLRNSSIKIAAQDSSAITIIGVDNKKGRNQGFHTIDKGNLPEAMKGTEGFRILLTHDPSHWDSEVLSCTDIPLTLSGHTHAAQIRIFGWTPASLMFSRTYGRYDEGGQTLFVNPGLGCTLPFRIGANPEITVITLKAGLN